MMPISADGDRDMLEMIKAADRPADSDLRVIIFTATYFLLDGVTLTIRRLEGHLREMGAQVKVVSTVPDDVDAEHLEHIIVVPGTPLNFVDAGYAFGAGLDPETYDKIEAFNPNVAHFTVPDFVGMDGIKWCQKNNIAYLATWHSNLVDYLQYISYLMDLLLGPPLDAFLKNFYEQFPYVYVPTPYMQKKMIAEGYGAFTEIKKWGRGCDLKIFRPDRRSQSFRQSKGIAEDDVVILWVGRLVPEKRPDIWLEVVRRLQGEGIPVKCLLAGHGAVESSFKDIDYHSCGWLSGLALAEAYASSDVLLFPSGVETFGNVTLEALASGCVAIVEEKCSGHLVTSGYNGYTCPDGDFEAYYQATKKAVTDSINRKKMSEQARESAWAWERSKILQQMVDNYKDAIVNHRDPSFIKRFVQQSAQTQGRNLLSFVCCDFVITKRIVPMLMTFLLGAGDVVVGAKDCATSSTRAGSRVSCASLASLDYSSIENKINDSESLNSTTDHALSGCAQCMSSRFATRAFRYVAILCAYSIVFVLILTCFDASAEEDAIGTLNRRYLR